ncbi:hypothetical protein ON010_g17018 [Phytophthora cinnamomi]|nr:hypothetical protein ON010_g17018 [Phytophthora cinnamomi]
MELLRQTLQKRKEQELHELRAEYDVRIEQLKQRHDRTIMKSDQDYETAMNQLRDMLEAERRATTNAKNELIELRVDLERTEEELKEAHQKLDKETDELREAQVETQSQTGNEERRRWDFIESSHAHVVVVPRHGRRLGRVVPHDVSSIPTSFERHGGFIKSDGAVACQHSQGDVGPSNPTPPAIDPAYLVVERRAHSASAHKCIDLIIAEAAPPSRARAACAAPAPWPAPPPSRLDRSETLHGALTVCKYAVLSLLESEYDHILSKINNQVRVVGFRQNAGDTTFWTGLHQLKGVREFPSKSISKPERDSRE